MFFKPRSILYLITLSFVSFVFVSCNLKIGEQPYRTDNIDLKPRPCTKELATRTKKYFYGELEKEDSFESISSCVNRGLDNFLKIYEADQPNYYSPIKLSNFLHRYYLKDQKISENLLEEIMNIKKVLFGGSNLMISKSEIQNLQKLIEIVGYHAKQLRPFMPILSQKVDELSTDEHLKEGFRRLRVAAKDLISILSLSKSSYQFGHFAHLLDELRMFFQWDKAFEKTKSIYDWMYLVETIKLNMIGDPAESLSSEQWEPFVDAIIDSYEIYVYYHYFIRSKPFYKGKL
ncbi:MAG: hypothetical protein KDD50_00575, partial [Bdellovibrionales bacterium]|nr:hypothetical protein [Bdellovibrionales bacterium]